MVNDAATDIPEDDIIEATSDDDSPPPVSSTDKDAERSYKVLDKKKVVTEAISDKPVDKADSNNDDDVNAVLTVSAAAIVDPLGVPFGKLIILTRSENAGQLKRH